MATPKNYLSEFEQEWNSNFESPQTMSDEFELENDEELENDSDNEFELNDEFESEADEEFEITADNNELEQESENEYENEEGTNYEFEDRLYSVITGNHESELEFEQQLNGVLHEIEKDYFFKSLKRRFNKLKNSSVFKTLKKVAANTPIGSAIKQYTALARGDIKGMLKGLAGQALTAAVPGGGIAKSLLNLEAPVSSPDPRRNAKVINQVAKKAYSNLINGLSTLKPDQLGNIRQLGRAAYQQAWQRVGSRTKGQVRRITIKKGQTLVVKVI